VTTAWTAYQSAVLEPARQAGNCLPPDLCARYGINDGHLRDDDRFKARVEEITKYWKKLELTSKLYKSLAVALLADHTRLTSAGTLNPAEFRRERQAAREQSASRLRQWVTTIADDVPRVTGAILTRLVEMTDGLQDERQVRAELAKAKVTVIEPAWQVPPRPPVATAVVMRTHLSLLGLALSPQLVFPDGTLAKGYVLKGGFRLADGRRLTHDAVTEAQRLQAMRPHDSRKTAADTVLATLARAVADPATLDALVLWEIAASMQRNLTAGMPVRLVAKLAAETGLALAEAEELAVTLATSSAAGASADAAAGDAGSGLILEVLAAGDLREAERLLAAMRADEISDAMRAQVTSAAARVAELQAHADAAHRAGNSEDAARLLADAVQRARDDADLTARLARIPPPPAADVVTGTGSGQATLRWTPSPAQIGQISYRVRRTAHVAAVSAEEGDLVAETDRNQACDPQPPVAVALVYTVFASRDQATWSAGAAADEITLLPPVTDLVLSADARSVTGVWKPHPSTAAVTVTRSRDDRPGEVTPVPTEPGAASGFIDRSVLVGVAYTYTVTAIYVNGSGARLAAPPVAGPVVPAPEPTAVNDLTAEVLVDDTSSRLQLAWTSPAGGNVAIRRAGTPPPWPTGAKVPLAVAAGYGDALDGPRETGPNRRVSMLAAVGQGRFVCSAVTIGQSEAVIGNSVSVELLATVTGLRAQRRWDSVTVSWLWPQGAHAARIHWSTADQAGERTCTPREYYDNGGVVLETGPAEVTIGVATLVREGHELLASPMVTTRVNGRPPTLTWGLHQVGPLRRRVVLTLRGDQAFHVPALVLTAGQEKITRLEPGWITPEKEITVDVSKFVDVSLIDRIDCLPVEPEHDGWILTRHRGKR
jgi:hypothetical protein